MRELSPEATEGVKNKITKIKERSRCCKIYPQK